MGQIDREKYRQTFARAKFLISFVKIFGNAEFGTGDDGDGVIFHLTHSQKSNIYAVDVVVDDDYVVSPVWRTNSKKSNERTKFCRRSTIIATIIKFIWIL